MRVLVEAWRVEGSLSTGGTMVRFSVPAGLIFAHIVLAGCSYRQQVDIAQWSENRTARTTAEELSRPTKTRTSSAQAQPMISRAKDAREEVESVGTVVKP